MATEAQDGGRGDPHIGVMVQRRQDSGRRSRWRRVRCFSASRYDGIEGDIADLVEEPAAWAILRELSPA